MLEVIKLNKIYPNGVKALEDISFKINKGEFVAIIGLSGAGKSTLLRAICRLIDINSGEINFLNINLVQIKGTELRYYRSKMGMIFQHFNLISRMSVLNNVLMGNLAQTNIIKSILGIHTLEAKNQAKKFLDIVGLSSKLYVRADTLSGGEQQRVAIARALMQNPQLILADEPVASLDPATSHSIMNYLKKVNSELGVTIICNLHFLSLVREYSTRVIALKASKLIFDGIPENINDQWFKQIYGEDTQSVSIK